MASKGFKVYDKKRLAYVKAQAKADTARKALEKAWSSVKKADARFVKKEKKRRKRTGNL